MIRKDNIALKADLDLALAELNALRDKGNNVSSENNDQDNSKKEEKINKSDEDNEEDVWTSIRDVCEKYQALLASLIVDQVHNTEVAQMLSDVAKNLAEKTDPKKAFETMLGESAPTFFQSLRVPDWTLLYFKLQSKIPDQGWQTLLNITNLGRTEVS